MQPPTYKSPSNHQSRKPTSDSLKVGIQMAGGYDEVKLIGSSFSPFVMRVRVALNLKGVGYEFLEETPGSKSELLLKSNPVYKKIPVLFHHDKPICESMIIIQYIEETWPSSGPALLPSDPYDRAISRFWVHFVDDKLFLGVKEMIFAPTEEALAEVVEQLRAAVHLLEEAFEKCTKGKGYFNGDNIGYLDLAFGSYLGWLRVAEKISGGAIFDEEKTPLLSAWADRFCADAVVKGLMPETDKLIEYRKMAQASVGTAAAPTK